MWYHCIYLLLLAAPLKIVKPDLAPPAPRHERPAGVGQYGKELVDSIHGQGLIKLNGTKVATALKVEGSLTSIQATIGTMEVYGTATLRDTLVEGVALVVGSLKVNGSKFLQPLTVNTSKVVFVKAQIHSLILQKEPSFKAKQVVELKQGTVIEGTVHFEGGKGEILIDSSSRINGKVTGGKVIYKN